MHRFHDGSILKVMMAKDLAKLAVWKGNRTLDMTHAKSIRDAIGSAVENLDSGYRIVNYEEEDTAGRRIRQSYLIDGQHRQHVLKEHFLSHLCEPDFEVIVQEKDVESEAEAIAYFNAINNVKPQRWTDTSHLVNLYIQALQKQFTFKYIKQGGTHRPYLSVDKLRVALQAHDTRLVQDPTRIQQFVQRVVEWNAVQIANATLRILENNKESKFWERAEREKFMLAVEPGLKWVGDLV